MSENEDRYHDTVLDLEAKLKKNVDLILKLGNSLQGMFMLGPKLLSVYDQQLKPIGWGNSEISLAIRDSEDTLLMLPKNCWTIDYAQINALYKDFVPQKELSALEQKYFPSSFIPSDKNSNATPSIQHQCQLQPEKKNINGIHSFTNKNTNPLDYSWISKMEKLEDENVSLDFTVQSLIKERDNVKLEYQKLFNSIKKTRSQTQMEIDELIAHVSEKTYAYGAIRAEN
ncbi:hypothetical protein Tco_0479465 [Tanacetum coccineum]